MPRLYNRFEFLERRRTLRQQSSKAERILWECLRVRRFLGYKFRRQQSLGYYIADFYCPALSLVVEVDGEQHLFPAQAVFDARRTAWLKRIHIRVFRCTTEEVKLATDLVLKRLQVFITSLDPSSGEEGR